MQYVTFAMIISLTISVSNAQEEGTWTATKYAGSYTGTIISDNAGAASGAIQDAVFAASVPTKAAVSSAWGYIVDIKDGVAKRSAVSNGDGVSVNASVYSLALRQAERENTDLKNLQKDREKRQYDLKRAQEETTRLGKLAGEYKDVASKFQSNISATVEGIADSAKKLDGWDKAHQKKLDQLLSDHKKLGSLTADDGNARTGEHTLLSMRESLADLETFIKKSPESAAKAGLTTRLGAMTSLMEGAQLRLSEKERQMMDATAKINELSKTDENKVAATEADMQRRMILGTLNNSVNNLINNGEFSKVRSQLAFTHFKEVEKEMSEKGVKAGDVKKAYKLHSKEIAEQYNNTPLGLYVNEQITKAMGAVCDLVTNQCKDGSNAALFDFLDDTSRGRFKIVDPEQSTDSAAPTATRAK